MTPEGLIIDLEIQEYWVILRIYYEYTSKSISQDISQ